ncbi:MAG TPA: hypothetical protein VN844_06520 [Pyrinomonadaceae bacterium]|nr:hypothetical protein [Pyrinomonadaceae bacterium]
MQRRKSDSSDYRFDSSLPMELKDCPMETLRQEKIDMYEELKVVSLGHDFLESSFDDLRKVFELLPKERADIRWYVERIITVIEAMEHRLEVDDIADSVQSYTYEFFKEEKDKLQRLLNLYA